MPPRPAVIADAREVVRLAELMYDSMGIPADPSWAALAIPAFEARLDRDVACFVVDHPTEPGRLCSSGCGVINTRLPSRANPGGRVGYIMWVATDAGSRRRGHGQAIIRSLIEWFRDRRVPMVELHATTDGETVYRRAGFGTDGALAMRRATG